MAAKLPPEEQEKIKAGDFGHYVEGREPLTATPKPPIRKKNEEKKAKGRPRKHPETPRPVSFRLPEKIIRRIRAKAALEGKSPADLIIEWAEGLTLES